MAAHATLRPYPPMRRFLAFLLLSMFLGGTLFAVDPERIPVYLDGHVKKPGEYSVDRHVTQDLDGLIQMAGGFAPSEEFGHEISSSVAWIERDSPEAGKQHIIIDYKNKQILSQRCVEGGKWRLERYDWNTFEYLPSDSLFITASRKSLDLTFVPIRYVQDNGWENFEKLRYFGKDFEATRAADEASAGPR